MNIESFNEKDVFLEEKQNLEINISKLDNVEKFTQLKWDKNKEEIDSCFSGDIEDFRYKQGLILENQQLIGEVLKYRQIKNNPYFGRMLLESDKEKINMYIGESSVVDLKNNQLVYDWRAPVASLFYSNQIEYKFKDYLYSVELKRKIIIESSKIMHCYQIFSKKEKNGKIVDEFLKSILNNKKNSEEFVDIIKTIQDKQNAIIREEKNKNVIVQGVAGSGKTVVILHRLSYLLFNNPEINPSEFLFIAPTEIFKNKLNNLNKKLQIDKIEVFTIFEYYKNKINSLFDEKIRVNEQFEKIIRVDDIINDNCVDEKEILLKYSDKYYKTIFENLYNQINNRVVEITKDLIVFENSDENDLILNMKILRDKTEAIRRAEFSNKDELAKEIYNISLILLDKMRDICKFNNSNVTNSEKPISELQKLSIEELQSAVGMSLKAAFETRQKDSPETDEVFKKIENTEKTIVETIDKITFILSKTEKIIDTNLNFENHAEFFSSLKNREEEFQNILKIKNNILVKNEGYINKKQTFFSKIFNQFDPKKLEEYNEKLSSEIQKVNFKLEAMREIEELYKNIVLPNINNYYKYKEKNSKTSNELNNFKNIFDEYNSFIAELYSYSDYIRIESAAKKNFQNIYILLYYCIGNKVLIRKSMGSDVLALLKKIKLIDFPLIDKCNLILNELSEICLPTYLWKNYFNQSLKYCEEVGFKLKNNKLNRVDAYMLLRLAVDLGYKRTRNYNYIYIDEAQDYNDSEISLIYNLEGHPTLNIYGDVKQSIFKNVLKRDDWKGLEKNLNLTFNKYELNENYRNTIEVVEYCNKNLNLTMIPIGNRGCKVVLEKSVDLNEIINKSKNENYIVITNNQKYLKYLKDNDVKCCSIPLSKGLEFTNVIGITDNSNSLEEKYVLYTRTLNNLVLYQE